MWKLVLVSTVMGGVLTLGAAGRGDEQKGKPLPQSLPFASTRPAALGILGVLSLRMPGLGQPQEAGYISVTVPQEDAELTLNGDQRTGAGLVRVLSIVPRSPTAAEAYDLTVTWRPNNYTVLTRRARVTVRAGESAVVDLSRSTPSDTAQIRYVATPMHVVAEMIALAGVQPHDVVFEPGCGDARLTIAAVLAGARRGVGIDLDAERVSESRSKVEAAGLSGRIEIRQGNALAIPDLTDASLVFLYMGDEFNRLIRPVLRKQLRVGARVVSHRFTMGDWLPDKTVSLPDEGGNVELHLWTITAAVKEPER